MTPYFFHFDMEPHPDNPKRSNISGATALIWVFEHSVTKAKEKAVHHIDNNKWMLKNIELSMEITSELILDMGDDEVASYRKAESNGIEAHIRTWKKTENLSFETGKDFKLI